MDPRQTAQPPSGAASDKIDPTDLRYAGLVRRDFNKRCNGQPQYVRLVGSTEQVVAAVSSGQRLAARNGGRCLDSFVDDLAGRVIIDTSLMTDPYFDANWGAFAAEPGLTLGEVYRRLFLGWGNGEARQHSDLPPTVLLDRPADQRKCQLTQSDQSVRLGDRRPGWRRMQGVARTAVCLSEKGSDG